MVDQTDVSSNDKIYLWQAERIFQGNPVFGILQGRTPQESKLVCLAYSPEVEIDGHWFPRFLLLLGVLGFGSVSTAGSIRRRPLSWGCKVA